MLSKLRPGTVVEPSTVRNGRGSVIIVGLSSPKSVYRRQTASSWEFY